MGRQADRGCDRWRAHEHGTHHRHSEAAVDLVTHDVTQVNYVNRQADLIVQATVELIDEGNFVAKVYKAMVYLCKQNTLIISWASPA